MNLAEKSGTMDLPEGNNLVPVSAPAARTGETVGFRDNLPFDMDFCDGFISRGEVLVVGSIFLGDGNNLY